jgi:hypothetical protein
MRNNRCRHRRTIQGPNIARRWGSSTTEICEVCGWWRKIDNTRRIRYQPPVIMMRELIHAAKDNENE